jgi:mono/diheme cytochrome c family protein
MTTGIAAVATLAMGGVVWQAMAADTETHTLRWQDAAVVDEGAAIYRVHCASCHGADLEGQPDWRVRMDNGRLPAPPHDATGHTWHHPDAVLIDITTRGTAAVVGRGYESDMIGYQDLLSPEEIIAVLSYIKSTWPPEVIEIHTEINRAAAE